MLRLLLHNKGEASDPGPSDILGLLERRATFVDTSGPGFQRLLLTELTSAAPKLPEALGELPGGECTRLCVVLVEVAKEQRRHCLRCLNLRETCHDNLGIRLVFCGTVEFSGGIAAARTSHLTKMVPALVERLLEHLELLHTEEILQALQSLSDLGYRDNYLSDRFAEALKARLSVEAQPVLKALRVLARQSEVSFLELFSSLLQESMSVRKTCWLETRTFLSLADWTWRGASGVRSVGHGGGDEHRKVAVFLHRDVPRMVAAVHREVEKQHAEAHRFWEALQVDEIARCIWKK
eukprot:g16799.t1